MQFIHRIPYYIFLSIASFHIFTNHTYYLSAESFPNAIMHSTEKNISIANLVQILF